MMEAVKKVVTNEWSGRLKSPYFAEPDAARPGSWQNKPVPIIADIEENDRNVHSSDLHPFGSKWERKHSAG